MQLENKHSTIKTGLFNNFVWNRLPIEHDYITIIFCLDKYKNTDNSNDFLLPIENEDTKNAIKYILNIMPYKCIINIDDYSNYRYYRDNMTYNKDNKDDTIIEKLDKLNIKNKDTINKTEIEYIKNKLKKIEEKKTYIFTYDENKNKILNMSIDLEFNNTHRVCIGELENISKCCLSVSDYIFFENIDILNKYLETQNHNLRIKKSDAPIYLIDKCNYEYYNLFNFNKHIKN
jgi:hypothetical protein